MAPAKTGSKRKPKRKARTEVSSCASDSKSDTSSSSPAASRFPPAKKRRESSMPTSPRNSSKKHATSPERKSSSSSSSSDNRDAESLSSQPVFPTPSSARKPNVNEAFEQFYLKQATREFAEDLEKLRAASDFRGGGGKGVEGLVRGLRVGVECFGEGERGRVVGGGDGGGQRG